MFRLVVAPTYSITERAQQRKAGSHHQRVTQWDTNKCAGTSYMFNLSSLAGITSRWQPSARMYFMSFWTSWCGVCASLGNSLMLKNFPNAKIVLWLLHIKQRSNPPSLKPNLPWPQGHTSKLDLAKVPALSQRLLQLPYNQIPFPAMSHTVWDRKRLLD